MGSSVEGSKPTLNPGQTYGRNTGVGKHHTSPGDSTLSARLHVSAVTANHRQEWVPAGDGGEAGIHPGQVTRTGHTPFTHNQRQFKT